MARAHDILAAASLVVLTSAAAAIAGPPPVSRERVLAEVDSLHAARDVSGADSLITASLATVGPAGDDAFVLELLVRRGRLHVSFGQSARAIPTLTEAMELAESRRDSLNLARATRWLSVAQGIQGRQDVAGELYRKLLDISVARNDHLHEGWAHVGMGWQALNRGLLDESRDHYERAIDLFVGLGDHDAEIWARNGYAIVLQRQGDYPAALRLYRDLTDVARRTGNTIVEAMACNNAGSLLQKLGDPGSAIGHYERARALQLSIRQTREAVIPGLNIAVCLLENDQAEEAVQLLEELHRVCVEEGYPDLQADVLYELARARHAQNRLADAIRLHRQIVAMPAERPVGSHVRNSTGLARILAEIDSTATALAVVEDCRARWLDRTAGTERLMLDFAWGERLADAGRDADALVVLDDVARSAASTGITGFRISSRSRGAEVHLEAGRPDSALAWLRLAAAAWEAERTVPLDPRWREQRGTYGQLIYPRMAALLLEQGGDPLAVHAAIRSFKARTLLEAMLGPGLPAGDHVDPPAPLDSLLRPGELFLDYYLGPEASFVFAIGPDGSRVGVLPELGELRGQIEAYRSLLRQGAGDEAASAIAATLFRGVEDLVAAARTIVWSPDGPLHRIPLASLRIDGVLLDESHAIARVPSADALALLRSGTSGVNSPPGILAIAGTTGADGTELPGPRREVRQLERNYRGVEVLVDPIPERILRADPVGVIHIAAHAYVDARHPWQSSFLFAEPVTAATIGRRRLTAGMAVLASCESVGGRALAGEGQPGLSSAFLGAGVPSVVATLWPVSDRSARAFSGFFYERLAAGETIEVALRRSRSALRERDEPDLAAAWAAFVLVGEGGREVSLERRAGWPPWLGPVGAISVLLLAWAGRRKRLSAA